MSNAQKHRPKARAVRIRPALAWTLILISAASAASAAPLRNGQGYTVVDGSRRAVVLDQDGRRIPVPRPGGSFPEGTTPTYLATPLAGRSQLPDGVPAVVVSPSRDAAGPLRLNPDAIQTLNSQLTRFDQVAVLGPRQAFLVESAGGSQVSLANSLTDYWRANIEDITGGKSFGDTVQGWYDSSAGAVKKLNSQIADAFKRAFRTEPIKPVIIGPPRVAAQVLEADATTSESITRLNVDLAADFQPAPVPEPSTWLVFAAAGILGLRLRRRIGS